MTHTQRMAALILFLAAGCFEPRYEEGIACSELGTCPPGMTCDSLSNRCWARSRPGVCGDGVVNELAGEICDPARDSCCAATCDDLLAAGTECRSSSGPCDPAESCTGMAAACPPDEFAPAMTDCRAGNGICDPAEVCDGLSAGCPSDAIASDGSTCSDCTSGLCDTCMAGICPDLYPRSCQDHMIAATGLPSGIYTIDPDGTGTGEVPFEVYCDMITDGGGWTRVFYEDTSNGDFFPRDEFELNKGDPGAALYAILNDLEKFRRNGELEFLMRWPGHPIFTENQHWAQTSNPVMDTAGAIPMGYRAISIPYMSNGWSLGLQRSLDPTHSLLDGTLSPLSNWYYAVGTTYCWGDQTNGCQPAPYGGAHIVELLVR